MLGPTRANVNRLHGTDWLRLRTLLFLRWAAILGQAVAIAVATLVVGIELPMDLCALALGAAVLANLLSMAIFPENRRLTEAEAFLSLLFDLCQLALMLFVTGGLSNPFAVLILAPAMVSASALNLRSTLILGGLSILFVVAASTWFIPLRDTGGQVLVLPSLFSFGFALSICIGILFMGLFSYRVAQEMRAMSDALAATQMALAREQKLTDLGGVVAAAAHELGTPLATIKLVATELIEIAGTNADLAEDARLIRDQADRCRDILRSMGKAGKSDEHMKTGPLCSVIREAAEPHLNRGKTVIFKGLADPQTAATMPDLWRRPELIHGLRNLIQNAVDFASARVNIHADLQGQKLRLVIIDDGIGFPPQLLGRIGDPFLRGRTETAIPVDVARPGYEGMGLGLFIAKTLLERTGADLVFGNAADPFLTPDEQSALRGAVVTVTWAASEIVADAKGSLGPNRLID
jgi:two-component system sensor histidine kinase RegB